MPSNLYHHSPPHAPFATSRSWNIRCTPMRNGCSETSVPQGAGGKRERNNPWTDTDDNEGRRYGAGEVEAVWMWNRDLRAKAV